MIAIKNFIYHKSSIKPPWGLIYFKPIWGGGGGGGVLEMGGLFERWGLI